ncbi:hypothetical protein C8P68_101576 [Mucilaginibacter yixingensis]|uniref:Uncharacterized protein n=1 Tax=Mucilaginibacter yixingensis TaxID=1295612 RepID=A0A2T5JFX9_9SPHI|nr:hypothetical protein C8P68_101576 [Mucilaginibacter yixingensis]
MDEIGGNVYGSIAPESKLDEPKLSPTLRKRLLRTAFFQLCLGYWEQKNGR